MRPITRESETLLRFNYLSGHVTHVLSGLVHLCGSTLYRRPSAAAETLHAGADAGGLQTQTDADADTAGTTATGQTASAADV